MSNVEQVASFVRSHSGFAAITADGLLATMPARHAVPLRELDDMDFDEPMVFEHDENGDVSVPAVRRWLGY